MTPRIFREPVSPNTLLLFSLRSTDSWTFHSGNVSTSTAVMAIWIKPTVRYPAFQVARVRATLMM